MKFNREKILKKNKEGNMWFVKYWANYVRTHPDKEWSKQQNVIINSMFQNAKSYPLTREQYLEIKSGLKKNK